MRTAISQATTRKSSVGERGFTLAELILVVALMAIIAAFALPNFRAGARQREVRTSLQEFVASIRTASSLAVFNRRTVQLRIDAEEGEYSLAVRKAIKKRVLSEEEEEQSLIDRLRRGVSRSDDDEGDDEDDPDAIDDGFEQKGEPIVLPEHGSFGEIEGGRLYQEENVVIEFFPAGGSSGGSVELLFDEGKTREQSYVFVIDPLVSSVSIESDE